MPIANNFIPYRRSIEELIYSEVSYNHQQQKFESEQAIFAEHLFNLLFLICELGSLNIADAPGA